MLKERKAQDEDPTSHIQEEESTSSPAESVVDEPNPTSHLQEEEATSSPPESIVDETNPKRRRGKIVMQLFVLMHNTTLSVNYHLPCNLTP